MLCRYALIRWIYYCVENACIAYGLVNLAPTGSGFLMEQYGVGCESRWSSIYMDTVQGKKPVILLIEADDALRRLIGLGLQHRNMHVIEASAAEQVPTLNVEHLDMLVLDLD